jgi:hypothetical protein
VSSTQCRHGDARIRLPLERPNRFTGGPHQAASVAQRSGTVQLRGILRGRGLVEHEQFRQTKHRWVSRLLERAPMASPRLTPSSWRLRRWIRPRSRELSHWVKAAAVGKCGQEQLVLLNANVVSQTGAQSWMPVETHRVTCSYVRHLMSVHGHGWAISLELRNRWG